jgi:hypothetical protein
MSGNEAMKEDIAWRTSSYSVNGSGQCVEVGWRTSAYSVNGSQCVEAGVLSESSPRSAMRDSKHRSLGHLDFTVREWAAFLHEVKLAG